MRYSRKRETYASFLFACLLAALFSCVGNVSRMVDPKQEPDPPTCHYDVALTLDRPTLAPAESTQANTVVTPLDGTPVSGQTTWSAQNPVVATVSPQGVVTAVAVGTAVIQATVSGCTGAAPISVEVPTPVEVPIPQVAAVTVAVDSTSLAVGHLAQATATPKDAAGKVITGEAVTWASLAPNVATISASGAVTAIAGGTATIQATISGIAGTAPITVEVPPPPQVAAVAVAVDSTSLAVGHLAQAIATPKDAAGNVITGRTVTWECLAPGVATVSPAGVVQALAPGSAMIEATVSGTAGVATLTVVVPVVVPGVVPPNLASHDFNNGTIGPYVDVWGGGNIDFPDDPTASGRGKVARLWYRPGAGNPGAQTSTDVDVAYDRRQNHVRYGYTIWMKGDLYMPYPGSALKTGYNRKLIDFTGGGQTGIHTRMVLHRSLSKLYAAIFDNRSGFTVERFDDDTGITLADDTWHTIEVRMTTNSADGVLDGILEIYMNGEATPSYSRTTGLGWITEAYPGGSFFSVFYAGSQLTIDANQPLFEEYRYWDNVVFSTTRIGQ